MTHLTNPMNPEQIKSALNEGKTVFWKTRAYVVIKDRFGFYWVEYSFDGHKSPLFNSKGLMTETPEGFFTI